MTEELRYLIWFVLAVVAIYVIVRTGSFAYFRTRLEHLRRVKKEIKGED